MYLKNKFIIFTLIISLFLTLFTNCPVEVEKEKKEEKPTIIGYWKSSYGDGFEITKSGTFYQYDNANKAISFAGSIVNHSPYTSTSGFITVKITDSGTWGMTQNYYYVIRWKNFSVNSIQESCAYKAGGKNSGLPTQNEAETEYTEANGYFAYYGDYIRQ